jgi:hypothetical protein
VGSAPPFDGQPRMLSPPSHRGFVALPGTPGRLLRAPVKGVEQPTYLPRVRGNAKFQTDEGGAPTAGPELSAKAVGGRTSVQQCGPAGHLLGRQPPWGPGRRPAAERLGTDGACPGPPLTDGPSLTPKASAIWRCDQPRCLRRQAWMRRASFQS